MSNFRTGNIDKSLVPGLLRGLAPVRAVDQITDVDLDALKSRGKNVLLLDVDNTLVVWRGDVISPEVEAWLQKGRDLGFLICLLSNTRNRERLKRLAAKLGVKYTIGRFKPSRYMYRKALHEFGAKPSQAMMIGDQLFTDILGANRAGIEAIWVRQIAPKDLAATKISRFGERLVRPGIYRGMARMDSDSNADLPVGGTAAFELLRHQAVRQFVKFCIVGGTSTVIDKGLLWVLMFYVGWGDGLMSNALGSWLLEGAPSLFAFAKTPDEAAVPVLNVFTAALAILNSFVWNRRWTFRIRGREHRAVQLKKFFFVAGIGFGLNILITSFLHTVLAGGPERTLAIGAIVATVVVAFWNFLGQKLWTFQR